MSELKQDNQKTRDLLAEANAHVNDAVALIKTAVVAFNEEDNADWCEVINQSSAIVRELSDSSTHIQRLTDIVYDVYDKQEEEESELRSALNSVLKGIIGE